MQRTHVQTAFGKHLEALIKRTGVTQSEIARRADMRPSAISGIITGRTKFPSLRSITGIAKAIGVPLESLLKFGTPDGRKYAPRIPVLAWNEIEFHAMPVKMNRVNDAMLEALEIAKRESKPTEIPAVIFYNMPTNHTERRDAVIVMQLDEFKRMRAALRKRATWPHKKGDANEHDNGDRHSPADERNIASAGHNTRDDTGNTGTPPAGA